ncbi:MAG: 16S rRNA processing protein RimM [Candidatus Riflebacteria bacterium]|nr:16S rRNA processing protein RimM [Candidatus Riflebacteria bacterium]
MSESQDLVTVGRIAKTVGLDGWLKVVSFSDFPERFEPGEKLWRESDDIDHPSLLVKDARCGKNDTSYEVLFAGYEDVESAKAILGEKLFVPRSERFDLPEDCFYPDELTGLKVLSPEGKVEGEVLELDDSVPQPYITVKTPLHGEVMIPFKKVFIASIDLSEGNLVLNTPISMHVLTTQNSKNEN